ncbi:MAG: hypothetical protein AB1576_14245 [Bacillota bacterium]|jgi:hypothetical protein
MRVKVGVLVRYYDCRTPGRLRQEVDEPAAPESRRGMVVAVSQVNNSFEPYGSYAEDTLGPMQVYDTLVIKDEDGKIALSIAER